MGNFWKEKLLLVPGKSQVSILVLGMKFEIASLVPGFWKMARIVLGNLKIGEMQLLLLDYSYMAKMTLVITLAKLHFQPLDFRQIT